MAWVATDDFESGSNGANIAGTSGGSGWSAAWSKEGSANDWIYSNSTPISGTLSASHTPSSASDTGVTRNMTSAVTSGTVTFKVYRTSNSTGVMYAMVRDSGDAAAGVMLNASGNIVDLAGSTIQAYSASTVYTINIEFDYGTDQYRISVDGGAYSSWINMAAAGTSATRFIFRSADASSGVTNKLDDIGNGAVVGPTTVKTWDGVTQSTQIKQYMGVDLANVKTVDGAS